MNKALASIVLAAAVGTATLPFLASLSSSPAEVSQQANRPRIEQPQQRSLRARPASIASPSTGARTNYQMYSFNFTDASGASGCAYREIPSFFSSYDARKQILREANDINEAYGKDSLLTLSYKRKDENGCVVLDGPPLRE